MTMDWERWPDRSGRIEDPEQLRRAFHQMALQDRETAAASLNRESFGFPALFLLLPEIAALDLYDALQPRALTAIRVCAQKARDAALCGRLGRMLSNDGQTTREAFLWMLQTGWRWDGPEAHYDLFDAALDFAAAQLILTFRDMSVLPVVCALIFRRNRLGLLVHDLAWCLFRSCEVTALKLTAQHILSDHPDDVELAGKLLHLPMSRSPRSGPDRVTIYRNFLSWLQDNDPYLYFTGEHFQQSAAPEPVLVNFEARYLCRRIDRRSAALLEPLSEEESKRLASFRKLVPEDRERLSAASAQLHMRDIRLWQSWMGSEVSQQLALLHRIGR